MGPAAGGPSGAPTTAGQRVHGNLWANNPSPSYGGTAGADGAGNSLGALSNYFNSSGGQFQLGQGLDALGSKFGALGLSRSGAAMKAMEQFRHDLVSTKLDNYLGQLNELSRLSLGAGGLIGNAGQYSKGTGATQGLGGLIGAALSAGAAASDRRAKVRIERIGEWDDRGDGLGKYRFAYKWAPNDILVGVMADEVEQLRPHAFIPDFARGYAGVDYSKLSEFA